MQCLHMWFIIGLCAISVNNLLASPVNTPLSADDKSRVVDLSIAGSNQQEGAEVSERDNEVGYLRKSNEKGGDGYQHFESYHDKDGDAYGYEKHEAFGKSDKAELLNGEKDKDEGSHYTYVQELGDKPKYQKYHSSSDDPGKNTNYHYSYNSDDDDEEKPQRSSSYKEDATKSDSSEEDNDDEGENDEIDEEKSTNFSFKVYSDDYAEDGASEGGDVNSKGSGNGNGYNFGHGKKNTDVDYSKKSDYTAENAVESEDDEEDNEDDDDDEEEEAADEKESTEKVDGKASSDQGKDKNNYSSFTTYTTLEGDEADDETDEIPKNAIRYQNPQPLKSASIETAIKEDDNDEEIEEESVEEEEVEVKPTPAKPITIIHVQPTKPITFVKPIKPTSPLVLVQEHRAGYTVEHNIDGKPLVQEHRAGYTVEHKSGDDEESDDSGKGHAGSVSKHLYEIYVTHDTGKAKAGGDSGDAGGGDSGHAGGGDSGDADGADEAKSEKLTSPKKKSAEKHNGGYEVNINYGQKQNSPKNNGNKSTGKKKSSLKNKKKQIIKPHTYEVEEYIEGNDGKKAQLNAGKSAGKNAAPQHHRDNGDYAYGQQFIYASEADSDAYYW